MSGSATVPGTAIEVKMKAVRNVHTNVGAVLAEVAAKNTENQVVSHLAGNARLCEHDLNVQVKKSGPMSQVGPASCEWNHLFRVVPWSFKMTGGVHLHSDDTVTASTDVIAMSLEAFCIPPRDQPPPPDV